MHSETVQGCCDLSFLSQSVIWHLANDCSMQCIAGVQFTCEKACITLTENIFSLVIVLKAERRHCCSAGVSEAIKHSSAHQEGKNIHKEKTV